MDFTVTAEQDELRRVVRSFLTRHSSEAAVRAAMVSERGYDDAVWRRMSDELGMAGLAIPEKYGGAGFGIVDLGIVFEEAGRALLCAPFLASIAVAAQVLLACDDEHARLDLLPGIAAGTRVGTAAVTGNGSWWPIGADAPRARERADGWVLDGTITCVLDGAIADVVLLAAQAPGGASLFAVESTAAGLQRDRLATMDQTRTQARLTFAATPARIIGAPGEAEPTFERALAAASILLAAEQCGVAAAALEGAVEYAKIREQYGLPIGTFQGIKHLCADMLVLLESARSAAYAGLWALESGDDEEIRLAASVARVVCSEALMQIAGDGIQVHGGIGFTWEHPAHLYFKRAKSSEQLFGTPAHHREVLARWLAR